jgi:sulfur-carrier protein
VTVATVRIPGSLRAQVGGASTVEIEGATVQEILESLTSQHPGIRGRLLDDGGSLRRFVNVFVDDEDIRHRDGVHTPVEPGQKVSILPAVAGGSE